MRSTWRVLAATLLILIAGTGVAEAQDDAATPAASVTLIEQRAIEIPDTRIISLSPDGRLIAAAKPIGGYLRGQLCVYDVATLDERVCADLSTLEAGLRIEDVTWSPDGTRLAFAEQGLVYFRDGDLWSMDTTSGALTNLDDDGFAGKLPLFGDDAIDQTVSLPVNPAFSPDGRTVAFSRSILRNGKWLGNEIAVVSADGGTPETLTRVTLDTPGVVYFGIRWAPDAARLFYSVHYPSVNEPRNGIWSVDANGLNQRQILGATEPDQGAPAVVQVSPRGDTLLAFYVVAAAQSVPGRFPLYALVDVETGATEPLTVPAPDAPEFAYVSLASISPDGAYLLTVSRLTNPDNQVFIRAIDGGDATRMGEPLTHAGPLGWGLIPTWARDGSIVITGGGALSEATLLRIEGSAAPPVATPEPSPSPATTPVAGGEIVPGATVIVNDDGVRMRAAPSRDAPAVLELQRGAELTVIGEAVEADGLVWWPVEDPATRTIGWVRAEFLSTEAP